MSRGVEESRSRGEGPAFRDSAPPRLLDAVAALVDKSLLRREEGADGEPRFRMLETVRDYALEELAAGGEEEDVRRRHAAWGLDLAERGWAAFVRHPVDERLLNGLEAEHDNLRAALAWLERSGDADGLLRLAGAMGPFWYLRSHRGEGRGWLERALARTAGGRGTARARALTDLGLFLRARGEHAEATRALAEGLVLWRAADDAWGVACAGLMLGMVAAGAGEYGRARALSEEALDAFRRLENRSWVAVATYHLGRAVHGQGDVGRAAALFDEALALYRETGDASGIALVLDARALAATALGDHARAAAILRESLPVWRGVGMKEGLADWLARVATLAAAGDQTASAARLFAAVEEMAESLGLVFPQPERSIFARARAAASIGAGVPRDAGRRLAPEAAVAEATAALDAVGAAARSGDPTPTPGGAFTRRQRQVLRLLVAGRTDREIAEALFISHRTVQGHVAGLFAKLGVSSRTAAATAALERGLVGFDPTQPR